MGIAGGHQVHGQNRQSQQTRQNHNQRHSHFEKRANDRSQLGGTNVFGGKHALHHQEVGGPVAHRLHHSQAKDNTGPVHAHGIIFKVAQAAPHVGEILVGEVLLDAGNHALPTAGFQQAKNRDQQRAKPDQEKLQHFIENRREQTTSGDVNRHRDRGNEDGEVQIPTEHHFHDHGHGVHVHAGHQNGHDGEGDGAQT